ncbi:uncharacterized protein LOC135819738 [Sycon ciliatum]|uniref:uncharacterized protein LOC135819738 n=1 Tax=Sycon ciliatum TaxID=27933 RepID=UPI0031F692A8
MSFSLLRRVLPPRPVLASDALHIVRWKSSRNAVEMDPEEYKEEAKKAKKFEDWVPEGGWTLQRKVARTVLDNAILTEQQQETIRELHTLSPETWTRSRLSKAFKVQPLVISEIISPSKRFNAPFLQSQRKRTGVLRTAERSLQTEPWSTGNVIATGLKYGLRGQKLADFINQKLSLDWGVPRHRMNNWTRRSQALGLSAQESADFVRQNIIAFQKRRVLNEQSPHRSLDENVEYDDDNTSGGGASSDVQSSADFELELENRLRALKADTQSKRGLRRDATPSQTLRTVAQMEEEDRGIVVEEMEERAPEPQTEPNPSDMLWQLSIDDDHAARRTAAAGEKDAEDGAEEGAAVDPAEERRKRWRRG